MYRTFPVFAGGISNEVLRCMVYDSTNDFLIMGGKTTSSDFAPAQNDHGFIFALDGDGNWRWGNFFYNVSYCISTITGCKLSSKNTYLTVYGIANSVPVVVLLNKADGSIYQFYTITNVQTFTTTPTYVTHSGFFFEESDPLDGKSYIYMSFIYNTYYMHIMKWSYSSSTYAIVYNKFLYKDTSTL